MNFTIVKIVLFCLLVPGVVLRLYPQGTTAQQAVVHGLVFLVLMHFIYRYENFETLGCPRGYRGDDAGDCRAVAGAQLKI